MAKLGLISSPTLGTISQTTRVLGENSCPSPNLIVGTFTPKTITVAGKNAHINICAPTVSKSVTPCIPVKPETTQIQNLAMSARTQTPIRVEELKGYLQGYHKADYLIDGFVNGFDLGYQGNEFAQAPKNASLAEDNLPILRKLVSKEVELNRFQGPFAEPPFPQMHISPLSLHEKSTPGEYRLLHNLSYPYDQRSVNLAIPVSEKTVTYETIGHAISHILDLGPQCVFGKVDIKSAFHIIPVRPSQYKLLGAQLDGQYYFDTVLAMGCGSSCKIFEEFLRAIVWVLKHRFGVGHVVHLIDNFLIIEPTFAQCQYAMDIFRVFARNIGLPLAEDKTLGPARTLTFDLI